MTQKRHFEIKWPLVFVVKIINSFLNGQIITVGFRILDWFFRHTMRLLTTKVKVSLSLNNFHLVGSWVPLSISIRLFGKSRVSVIPWGVNLSKIQFILTVLQRKFQAFHISGDLWKFDWAEVRKYVEFLEGILFI